MQIRIFTIPPVGGEAATEELNTFLRTQRVIEVRKEFAAEVGWCFCVTYADSPDPAADGRDRGKRQEQERYATLTDAQRDVYARLKEARKAIYQQEGISAYLVFTNIELMEIAKLPAISIDAVSALDGLRKDHVRKYGARLLDSYAALAHAAADENVGTPF